MGNDIIHNYKGLRKDMTGHKCRDDVTKMLMKVAYIAFGAAVFFGFCLLVTVVILGVIA